MEGIMAATRRTQFLMHPDEFRRLRALARQRKTSVSDLIRTAVWEKYLTPAQPNKRALVESIINMNLGDMDWEKLCEEIEDAHCDAFDTVPSPESRRDT
jgi:hypothetical protein